MEALSSREAADLLGINVQKFHRLAADLTPVLSIPGKRGAKFWRPNDVERLAKELEQVA